MQKFKTGIDGLDEITNGGLPLSRVTLVAGGPGSGKTLLLLTALVRGFAAKGKPCVFVSFEERAEDVIENARSIGLDIQGYVDDGLLAVEFIGSPPEPIGEAGTYTLDGLRMRIELAMRSVGASVLAIDTVETIFGMFDDHGTIRRELIRLFAWLKSENITTMLSGERGDRSLTRHGLEEYVSDCVILLDQRSVNDITTRRLNIVKYRGAEHGSNEFPFLIDSTGITLMPLTSARLDHPVLDEELSTGLDWLDSALKGGYQQSSTVLISGDTGTGKSMLSAACAEAAALAGLKSVVLSYEVSPDEYLKNILTPQNAMPKLVKDGMLHVHAVRPTIQGLERHLIDIYRIIADHQPKVMIVDPLSSLIAAGSRFEVHRTMIRIVDYLKRKRVTGVFAMEEGISSADDAEFGISSIMDCWIRLAADRDDASYHRQLTIVKKRGSNHRKEHLYFSIRSNGLELGDEPEHE